MRSTRETGFPVTSHRLDDHYGAVQETAPINAATRATIAATNAENAREQAMISQLQNDSFNDAAWLVLCDVSGKGFPAPTVSAAGSNR